MKKILSLVTVGFLAIASLTACAPAPTYSGEVSVTELEHVKFRPKMGNMPMRTAKWKVTVCPNDAKPESEITCWTARVKKDEFEKLSIGKVLVAQDGTIVIP